jgi:tetratricopeptide (TPR) repeat protein
MKAIILFLALIAGTCSSITASSAGIQPKVPVFIQEHLDKIQKALSSSDKSEAHQAFNNAISDPEILGTPSYLGAFYAMRSDHHSKLGDLTQAASDLQNAVNAFADAKIPSMTIRALSQMSVIEERRGQMIAAEQALNKARELAEANDLAEDSITLDCDLVRLFLRMGKMSDAEAALNRAEENTAVSESIKADVLMARARYGGASGDVDGAVSAYKDVLPKLLEVGNLHEAANAHYNAALLLVSNKRYEEAEPFLDGAEDLFRRAGASSGLGMSQSLRAWQLIEQDLLEEAKPYLDEADALLKQAPNLGRLAENDERYAHYWKKMKEPKKASHAAERAATTFHQIGDTQRALELRTLFPEK